EEVGGLLELENHRGDVRRNRAAGSRDENRLRVLLAGFQRRVLKLEAVTKREIEALRAVRPKRLVELRRRLRLLMRHLGPELLLNPAPSFVPDGVPAVVVDRSGSKQPNLQLR